MKVGRQNKIIDIKDIHSIELNILKYVTKVCKENNLRYYLCGGTLLGSIRHQGFIPWDDDIDISMPRPDYMKLLEILKYGERYKSLSFYNNDTYYYSFAKIIDTNTIVKEVNLEYDIRGLGVCIDIFPLDGIPNDRKVKNKHLRSIFRYRNLLYNSLSSTCPNSANKFKLLVRYFIWKYARLIGWEKWILKVEELGNLYSYDSSQEVGCIVSGYKYKEIMDKNVFGLGDKKLFEGELYIVPSNYDKYLKSLYGNYKELPPIEKRVTSHNFEAFIIDRTLNGVRGNDEE